MCKKKVLIVSRAFYPMIAPRAYRATELAKEFSRQGHSVTIITHKQEFDYSEFERKNVVTIEDFAKGNWKELKGEKIFLRGFRFLLKFLILYPDIQLSLLIKKALQNKSDYDLLISIAWPYPVHWGVALARKQNHKLCKVWVADCGDPFMKNHELGFRLPFYFQFIENWFCRKPDIITVPIKEAMQAYPSFCHNKIRVIPQGFQFKKIETHKEHNKNPFPTFAYAGLLGKEVRNPSQFLNYLATKKDQKFKFIIYTQNYHIVRPYIEILDNKIEIRNYIPREQLLDELLSMDFLVNFENNNNKQSPSKLIDYAIVGKPILSIPSSNINYSVVDAFLKGDYRNQLVINEIQQYNIINVVSKFLDVLE